MIRTQVQKNRAQHVFVSAGRPRPKLESAPGYQGLRAENVIGPAVHPPLVLGHGTGKAGTD